MKDYPAHTEQEIIVTNLSAVLFDRKKENPGDFYPHLKKVINVKGSVIGIDFFVDIPVEEWTGKRYGVLPLYYDGTGANELTVSKTQYDELKAKYDSLLFDLTYEKKKEQKR